MLESLNGKVAVITGATGRLCKTVALTLVRYGTRIVAVGRNESAARELVDEIGRQGGKAIYVICDINCDADRKKVMAEAKKAFGTVDIVINGAVKWQKNSIFDLTSEDYLSVLEANVVSPLLLARDAVKVMIGDGHGGRIINIASAGAYKSSKDSVCYDSSKTALVSATWAMASEWGQYGITSNCVAPGMTLVENEHRPEWLLEKNRLMTPTLSLTKAEHVANTIAFLASDDSGNINGVTIPIEGGLMRAAK